MIVWGGGDLDLDRRDVPRRIVPGLLIAARRGHRALYRCAVAIRPTERQLADMWWAILRSIPALTTPFIVVGGILLGWFYRDRIRMRRGALFHCAIDILLP